VTWKPLDPYSGPPEDPEPTSEQIAIDVAYFKRCADHDGLPYDPQWDAWLAGDRPPPGARGLAEVKRRFG